MFIIYGMIINEHNKMFRVTAEFLNAEANSEHFRSLLELFPKSILHFYTSDLRQRFTPEG